mgnify:CR=1 FL=1
MADNGKKGYLETSYPLSSNQKALWWIYKLSPNSSAYNVYTTTQINGDLNLQRWEESWAEIVHKYPILRTTYYMDHAEPIQTITASSAIHLQVIDSSQIREEDRKQQILQTAKHPFNLMNGPLIRVYLFQVSPQVAIQLVVIHEIAGELRSLGILLRDFFKVYAQK